MLMEVRDDHICPWAVCREMMLVGSGLEWEAETRNNNHCPSHDDQSSALAIWTDLLSTTGFVLTFWYLLVLGRAFSHENKHRWQQSHLSREKSTNSSWWKNSINPVLHYIDTVYCVKKVIRCQNREDVTWNESRPPDTDKFRLPLTVGVRDVTEHRKLVSQ
jgi:hypothetical protein